MNPHYNQQQPYYNYQQQAAGPPQPPWQGPGPQSPAGWNNPQYQNIPPQQPQNPQYNNFAPAAGYPSQYHPPPPPPAPSHTPQRSDSQNNHRPLSPQQDTPQWGVRYNQSSPYHHPETQPEVKPVLPPRPGSALSYSLQAQAQPQYAATAATYQQPPTSYQPQGSWGSPYNTGYEAKPPTPPPRPTAYTTPQQYGQYGVSHEQYSHQPPSHHYDPHAQVQQSSWQQPHHSSTQGWNYQANEGPVSPLEDDRHRASLSTQTPSQPQPYIDHEPPSQNLPLPPPQAAQTSAQPSRASSTAASHFHTTSTALGGFGGPSDWQHYDPTNYHGAEDEENTQTKADDRPDLAAVSPPSSYVSLKRKSMERIRPSSKTASPYQTSAQPVPAASVGGINQAFVHDSQVTTHEPTRLSQGPQRQDSNQSTISSSSGMDRADSIDNIIQAWNAPLTTSSTKQTSQPVVQQPPPDPPMPTAPKIVMADRDTQTDFKPLVETKIETRIETKTIEVDPFADIQNEYKATLKRFADMLRQEAVASDDAEKFKIFQGFAIRELKLRRVLYGVEEPQQEPPPKVEQPRQQEQPSVAQPARAQEAVGQFSQNGSHAQIQHVRQPQTLPLVDTQRASTTSSKDDSFVVVNANGEDDEYSPGGRPRTMPLRLKTPARDNAGHTFGSPQRTASPKRDNSDPEKLSPSLNAPMTLDDYIMPDQPSPSANAPMVVGDDVFSNANMSSRVTGPLNFQPDRPTYQPFRYGEGANNEIPADRAISSQTESFAALRQNQAAESGRTLVHDTPSSSALTATPPRGHSKTPSGGRREHEEAFIGLIRAKSQAIRKKANTTPRPESPAILRAGTPAARLTSSPSPVPSLPPLVKAVQSLRSLVPHTLPPIPGPKTPPHAKIEPLSSSLYGLVDDFGFIHARVLTWDKANRQLRMKLDSERQTRQSQNEEHIDHLFHEDEIGYADIADLEKDFKLEEAGRKYKEDQDELESFSKGVFEFVVAKLESEIRELMQIQTKAIDMLDLESNSAAKQVQVAVSQSATVTNPRMAAIMQLLLDVQEKLELRHLKIAEASFERERRKKRLELSVLYTNNDKPGIRKLDAEFAKAEKLQILEENRKKAERANRLLDSFDRAVVRGLAESQGVVDDIIARLQLVRDLVLGSEENGPTGQAREDLLYGPDGVRDLMDRTSATIDFIHQDSKTLIQLLDKADTVSNNADFDLYISEAKLADASPEKFEKLKSEKATEDVKVGEELVNRLGGVARGPEEITGLIKEVRDKIGDDVGHEERIGKALEAAKRRNTGGLS